MKIKITLTLSVIIILLFSIGTVVAEDNSTQIPQDTGDACDLVVTSDNDYDSSVTYSKGDAIKWTVNTESRNGVSKNVKVQTKFSNNLKIISHYTETGSYDSKTGTWDIGDMMTNQKSSLIINTLLSSNSKETFLNIHATTDSNDTNLENNELTQHISFHQSSNDHHKNIIRGGFDGFPENYTSKATMTTSTNDDSNYNHQTHYNPNKYSNFRTTIQTSEKNMASAQTNKTPVKNQTGNESVANAEENPKTDYLPIILSLLFVLALIVIIVRYRK